MTARLALAAIASTVIAVGLLATVTRALAT